MGRAMAMEVRHFSAVTLPLYISDTTANEMLLCPGSGIRGDSIVVCRTVAEAPINRLP